MVDEILNRHHINCIISTFKCFEDMFEELYYRGEWPNDFHFQYFENPHFGGHLQCKLPVTESPDRGGDF